MKEYTRETKLYAYSVIGKHENIYGNSFKYDIAMIAKYVFMYFLTVFFNLYTISIIFPSILNVFLYFSNTLEDDQLTLIAPVNKVSNAGALFFSLLIYQIISSFIFLIVGSVFYSTYLVFTQHACCQFSVIMYVFN